MTKLKLTTASLPEYEITLPISKKTGKFRPFVVREEKVLLLALQSKNSITINEALRNIVLACTGNEMDTKKMCSADAQYLFLQIRSKSVGEEIKPQIICSNCNTTTSVKIRLDQITAERVEKEQADPIIKINDEISVVMRYPTIHDVDNTKSSIDIAFDIVKQCIESVMMNDNVYEVKDVDPKEISDFVDALMPEQFSRMTAFLETTPALKYEIKYNCPKCSSVVNVKVDGVEDFFH